MWLSNSSVGRKFVMALSGAFLVLFVTFHCLMNAVAICWPAAYNSVCEFLGANWYALAASAVLALFIIVHIIYAVMLTVQNRKARGNVRYAISKTPKSVEWSSKNMFVLGIVILAFLVVHLIQFWAKMQLVEILVWTPIVYIIGFIALWFHFNHGFWSMFQSIGWDNNVWIPRLKKVACVWASLVVLCFIAQAIVFTVRANENYYIKNEALREQYKDMVWPMMEKDFGPDMAQLGMQIKMSPYSQVSMGLRQMEQQQAQQIEQLSTPEGKDYVKNNPQMQTQLENMTKQHKSLENVVKFFDYLEQADNKPELEIPGQPGQPQ